MTDMSIEAVASTRARLWDAGFRPVAICNHDARHQSPGKAPLDEGWQMLARQNPPAAAERSPDRAQLNTGILCDGLRAIDIDVDNLTLCKAIQNKALELFGETIIRYRNNSPRTLLVYRAAAGTPPKSSVASDLGKVEVLGRGQQFVAYGIHSSGAELRWMPEAPHEVALDTITALTEDQVRQFLEYCASILGAKAPGKKTDAIAATSRMGLRADSLQVVTALHAIPNDGPADWEAWNRVGMALWAATGGAYAGAAAWHAWSEQNKSYDQAATQERWDHYFTSPPTHIGAGTLFRMAKATRGSYQDDPGYLASFEEPQGRAVTDEALSPGLDTEVTTAPAKEKKKPLWVDDGEWDESAIPQRRWIARGYFLRGSVTLIAGLGSAGKSGLTVAYAVSLALGKSIGRFRPEKPAVSILYNVEDDGDEQRRRLSATLRQFDASPRDIAGRVIRLGPHNIGTLIQRDAGTGRLQFTDAMAQLTDLIEERAPDILFLDPLVELHTAEENDNTALRSIIAHFRSMAVQHDMAIVILHHARKGSQAAAGDPDMIRGASALVGAARVAITVSTMTDEEANQMNVPVNERHDYFRVDGAKANYSKVGEPEWFHRQIYSLDNEELVPAPVPWKAPSVFKELSADDCNRVLDRIAAGLNSIPYAPSKAGRGNRRWVGYAVMGETKASEEQAKKIVGIWMSSGLLYEEMFDDKAEGKRRSGVFVDNSKRPS